jgi:predicted Rossmann fold flavoprotein
LGLVLSNRQPSVFTSDKKTGSLLCIVQVDSVVIGGGAAGLMCAIEAAKRGRRVTLIEKAGQLGKKILISGGGRCNFTNIHASPANYISQNPHFCKSALSRYTPFHFIELVEQYQIAYHEKTLGQQFCDGSSRQIVELLKSECDRYGVTILLETSVDAIHKDTQFQVETNRGIISAETVVIATGGLSIPKMGATDFGHRIAQKFQLSIAQCRPGLVPLTFHQHDLAHYGQLSGVAFPTVASCGEHTFKESFLFTHKGVSGPAILQVSSYWHPGEPISLDLFPESSLEQDFSNRKRNQERTELKNVLGHYLPKKFAETFIQQLGSNRPINEYPDKELDAIAAKLHHWHVKPNGTEGYAKAEVTVGGVDTNELSSKTMESKKVPGLFFIGEVVDVTGHLGGYNFQWAWASGYAAGQYC